MSKVRFERVAVVGLGLIGSSLCWALRRHGLAGEVVGCDVSEEVLKQAEALGLAHRLEADVVRAVEGADLVVLAVPVGAEVELGEVLAGVLTGDVVLTDVGSVKSGVVERIEEKLGEGVAFVPGHPVAGTEDSGPAAGFAELFEGRWCILTPSRELAATAKVQKMWEACGSKVAVMDRAYHDRALAWISHLPHALAFAVVEAVCRAQELDERDVVSYSASGFRDFTRLAASDPIMWRDIFLHNREEALGALDGFAAVLGELRELVASGDGEKLRRFFEGTRRVRRHIVEEGQDTSEADFGRRR